MSGLRQKVVDSAVKLQHTGLLGLDKTPARNFEFHGAKTSQLKTTEPK